MSLSRSFVRGGCRLASSSTRSTASKQILAAGVRAQYRSYSSNNGQSQSQSSSRAKTPIAFGLVGLGGLGSWFGLGDKKDPATTQEGMLGDHPDVDYGAVYRDIGAFPISCFFFSTTISLLALIGRRHKTRGTRYAQQEICGPAWRTCRPRERETCREDRGRKTAGLLHATYS